MAKRLNNSYNIDVLTEMETNFTNERYLEHEKQCANCSKEAIKKCSQCVITYYCSRECQVENWTIHKSICKAKI